MELWLVLLKVYKKNLFVINMILLLLQLRLLPLKQLQIGAPGVIELGLLEQQTQV